MVVPQNALAKKQMNGFGGVVAFSLKGTYAETSRFVSSLRIPQNAVSLGGVESLLVHAAAMWAGTMTDDQMRAAKIQPTLVRLSVGLENAEDLVSDFTQALNRI